MGAPSSDRNLLLGIVALQMDFISRDALVEAMNQWTLEKSRTLSDILVARGALDPDDQIILDQMVDRHIARHGGDARQSLSALDVQRPARSVFEPIDDPDIQQSLSSLNSSDIGRVLDAGSDATESWGELPAEGDGRFRVLRLHERGGLGVVYLARDTEVNRDVALKQLKEEIATDPQSRARFVFEAEITGNLEHPGVVPVYGMGKDDCDRPYYAMRFVKGDTFKSGVNHFHHDPALLSDTAARQREFQKLLRRFLAVCETMEYVHNRGIIHRDLKPSNILLGPYGETLVVDWGLAKVVGRRETELPSDATLRPPSSSEIEPTTAGALLGTAAFMSPEQARGEVDRQTAATDIYGLGATLYYLLTGRAPIDGPDRAEVIRQVQRGEIRPPREVKPSVDRALDAICRKAMALQPGDRYRSARALGEDLERWLADQPVGAYTEPFYTRMARWVRRHRQLAGSLMILIVLALGAAAYHDWKVSREEAKARDQLRITLSSVKYLLKLCGINLARLPDSEKTREEVADNALRLCQQISENFPDDLGVQYESAQVYRLIAGIERVIGNFAKSRDACDQAIRVLTKLRDHQPGQSDYLRWLMQAYLDRAAVVLMYGKCEGSERDLRTALELADRLWSQPFPNPCRRVKGAALIDLSEILLLKHEPEEARRASTDAVKLLEPLAEPAKVSPANTPHDRWLLSLALSQRASAGLEAGDLSMASTDLDLAEKVCNRILGENGNDNDAQYQLACIRQRRGELYAKTPPKLRDAEQSYCDAAGLLGTLISHYQLIPAYREQMAATLGGRADVRLALRRVGDANKDCDESRRLVETLIEADKKKGTPENPQYSSLLGRTLERASRIYEFQGQRTESLKALSEAAERLTSSTNIDPGRVRDKLTLEQIKVRLEKVKSERAAFDAR